MHFIFREENYDMEAGSYLLMFKHDGRKLCVDATVDDGSMGRLMNHDRTNPNVLMRAVVVEGTPQIVFFAKTNISVGSELCYDYGERRKNILEKFPFLK